MATTAGLPVAIVGLVLAFLAWRSPVSPDSPSVPQTPAAAAVPASTTASSTSPPTVPTNTTGDTSEPVQVGAGACLDASGQATACDGPHTAEIVDAARCSPTDVLGLLGGRDDLDTLSPGVTTRVVDGRCVLSVGGQIERPLKGVLASSAGDGLRFCVDDTDAPTSCTGPHRGEVVRTAQGAASLDCDRATETYVGAGSARWGTDLAVERRALAGAQRCLVTARGDNVLTASLRRLGAQALPLSAR